MLEHFTKNAQGNNTFVVVNCIRNIDRRSQKYVPLPGYGSRHLMVVQCSLEIFENLFLVL